MTDNPTSSETLEELITSAAGGDRGAQEEILNRYWPVIRQAVRGRKARLGSSLAAREETQDLEQVVAIKVLEELGHHSWQGRSAFVAWVKKLSRHKVSDVFRHHRAQKRDVGAETIEDRAVVRGRSAESRFDEDEKVAQLLRQIGKLKEEYGAALMMFHLGFSLQQIGDTLDCSAEAARKLVARARAKLVGMQED